MAKTAPATMPLVEIGSWTRKDPANPKWLSIADLGDGKRFIALSERRVTGSFSE
jgi:hypothetical protein